MPIVFVSVTDPVSAGVVESLARPGGNATGFLSIEYGTSGKWLELLKDIAPRVTRVGIMRNPTNPTGSGHLGAIQAVAPSFGVELRVTATALPDFAVSCGALSVFNWKGFGNGFWQRRRVALRQQRLSD
jgi:ABC-type uncharacterized transport system substrate-binding protein